MEGTFERFPWTFARIRGRNGCVREYKAAFNFFSDYSFFPKVDAFRLGYPEVGYTELVTTPPNLTYFSTTNGMNEGIMIKIEEVAVGLILVPNVEFIAFEISQAACFDVVLGKSFLQSLKFEVDFHEGRFRLSQSGA